MHTLTWFEIPTAQLGRARDFYAKVTGLDLAVSDFQGTEMVIFPAPEGAVRGALTRDERHRPGPGGTIVYLDAARFPGGLDGALERAAAAGGKVLVPRTSIGPQGFFARIEDSEGNVVGLHVA